MHMPYDIAVYVTSKEAGSSVDRRDASVYEESLSWAEHAKRRPCTDSILLNSGTILQKWMLETHTHIECLRLPYLEKEQMRMVELQ